MEREKQNKSSLVELLAAEKEEVEELDDVAKKKTLNELLRKTE